MGLAKKISKNERLRGALCWLAAQIIRLLDLTGRWRMVRRDIPAAYWDQDKPFIMAFWHGRLLMMSRVWPRRNPVNMLISQHSDGVLIARTIAHFGIKTIAGSTTRGGAGALRIMLKALKAGESVGITPDGPKGPRMRASEGIIAVARMSGCPIIPAAFSANPRWMTRSWDRFLVPKPFSSGVFVWGDPIFVGKDDDMETCRRQLETILNALTDEADTLMGVAPVEPALADPA